LDDGLLFGGELIQGRHGGRKVNLRRVSAEPPYLVPFERTFDGTLGFESLEVSGSGARGRAAVADRIKQPWGLVHGGALSGFSESLCSQATAEGVWGDGMIAMGLANHTSFVRPITDGHVNLEARCRHRGRTTWLWEVDITDDQGRLCALSRVTVAVRPRPAQSPASVRSGS
jgi:1,4-dihydroxy-2-naphthoyl-CoA hydrolase